jgi:hypothetical protein
MYDYLKIGTPKANSVAIGGKLFALPEFEVNCHLILE